MAVIMYVSTVKNKNVNDKIGVHTCTINTELPPNRRMYDRYYVSLYTGITKIKLLDIAGQIERGHFDRGTQIIVFADDEMIARLGKTYGVEEGETAPRMYADIWGRIRKLSTLNDYSIHFQNVGLLTDSVRAEAKQFFLNPFSDVVTGQ